MTLTVKQSDQTKGWYVCDEDSVVSDVQDTKREAIAMMRKLWRRTTLREKKTFHGPTYRAQLWIFDYSDGAIAAWKNKPTTFAVSRMAQGYPKSASFSSAGDTAYYGDNFAQAVRCVSAIVHRDITNELPKEWKKYENQTAL